MRFHLLSGCLALLLTGTAAAAQDRIRFKAGEFTENVSSATAPGQRFTVYVPSAYDPSRPAPILYLMDPRGRGRVPAKLFQPAAERYGYILVSSHNSLSDGPIERNLEAMQAMWTDSHEWFRIDERRVYVAGFSGTARTASLVARNRPDAIAGIIGSGAGFHPDVEPSRDLRFLYFGATGDADYNFHEVETLEASLAELALPHRVETFAGPHSWMPPDLAMQAVEWLELRAMQSRWRARDESLLQIWWKRDEEAAAAALAAARPLDAARKYAAMARDYEGMRETAMVKALAASIGEAPEAEAELKRRVALGRRSKAWIEDAMQQIADAFPLDAATPEMAAGDLASRIEVPQMRKAAASGGEEALEARRRLNELDVQLGFYLPQEAITDADLIRAAYYLSVAVQINDASPVTWYLMAKTRARLNARAQALAALRRAVEAGFRDAAALEADPGFRSLRADAEYHAIVNVLRSTGDTLDALTVDRPPAHVLR